jgi:hypothetical protein
MSSLSNVSSLLNNILLSNQQSGSNQTTNTQTTNAQTQTLGPNPTVTVSLTSYIKEMENETLLNAESSFITGADNSSDNIMDGEQESDNSSGLLSDLFFTEENAQLMQANPALVKNIIAAEQAQLADSASSSLPAQSQVSDLQVLQAIGNVNLLTMNPDALVALQQKYTESVNSGTQNTSITHINKTV